MSHFLKYLVALLILMGSIICQVSSPDSAVLKNSFQTLSFQKILTSQIYPNVEKSIQIDLKQLQPYITAETQDKIMGQFLLQYKSVVRSANIHLAIFIKDQHKSKQASQNFSIFNHSEFQQLKVFELNFLSQFKFSHIQKIIIFANSKSFSVISLALLNNEILFEVDLTQKSQEDGNSFGLIPVWMPFSYDAETQTAKELINYVYFRAGESAKKLRIKKQKGHPKVFLYNCQTDRLDFCKHEIKNQRVEGTIMFQQQIEVSLKKEEYCVDCLIMIGFKNFGAETQVEISEHSASESVVLSKDLPVFYDMKRNSSLEVVAYYNAQFREDQSYYFVQISFVEVNSSSVKIQGIQIEAVNSFLEKLSKKNFLVENRTNALRIKVSPVISELIPKNSVQEIWYRVTVKLVSKSHSYFSLVDRNEPIGEENFITLKDGQIFHSYIFDESNGDLPKQAAASSKSEVESFKVKVVSISTLTISASCKEFNRLQIEFYSNPSQTTRINPKIFVENITNHSKKCSQLIHLNPLKLFGEKPEYKKQWVYIRITGLKDEVELLYSGSDMIILEKGFPYHSELQHKQNVYFYVPHVKNEAIIKITKCSDCHLSMMYSEEQIADIKTERSQPVFTKEVKNIENTFIYELKRKHGLYVTLGTNNFAHFVIKIEEVESLGQSDFSEASTQQTDSEITFWLQDENDKLILEFPLPQFLYTNALNSPVHYSLVEGSIKAQVAREVYCPEFSFSEKQRTRDVSITQITPELTHDQKGNEKMRFAMELKHHDFFGIRVQKGSEIVSYKVVNIESMKEFAMYRLSIFNVVLFFMFAIFMAFVCFMGLKRKRVMKIGGEVVLEETDGEQTSMVRLN